MHQISPSHTVVELFSPIYNFLYFVWPPFLVFLLRSHRRFMGKLITLWTVSGVLSVMLVLTNLSTVSLLPQFGPEPNNTVILVTLRLAMLVLLASLLTRPKAMGAYHPG